MSTKGHRRHLRKNQVKKRVKKCFCSKIVVDTWNKPRAGSVSADSIDKFKRLNDPKEILKHGPHESRTSCSCWMNG